MAGTEALYAEDAYLREFEGTIHPFVLMDGVLDEYRVLLGELRTWLGAR